MKTPSRRRFISQLVAASIGATTLSRAAGATTSHSNDGLAELCVIARQPGALQNPIIDVWAGQIGTVDLAQLPEHFGRVVVWHDIRGDRDLSYSLTAILFAIEEYLGIKPTLGSNASAHVGTSGELSRSIEILFSSALLRQGVGPRIAVVDLSSCGLTRLTWLDIIPLLRRYYAHIIGVDYSVPELCELDVEFEPPHGLSGLARETMQACDYWILASDQSLLGRVGLSGEERSNEFTKSIRSLCDCLSCSDDPIAATLAPLAQRQFVTFGAGA